MSTVSIHIEGHNDGSLDFPEDLAAALRHIADRLDSGDAGERDNYIPADVVEPYQSVFGDEQTDEDRATWSVHYGMY